jgi:hypothetical protein
MVAVNGRCSTVVEPLTHYLSRSMVQIMLLALKKIKKAKVKVAANVLVAQW